MRRSLLSYCLLLMSVVSPAGYVVAQDDVVETRKLADGVLRTIAPKIEEEETFSNLEPIYDLVAKPFTPKTAPITETLASKQAAAILRHDVWALEFTYKTLRKIELDIPQPNGKMQRKVIWYLPYKVKFNGDIVGGVGAPGEAVVIQKKSPAESEVAEIRFMPSIVLRATVYDSEKNEYVVKEYLDRVMTFAVKEIGKVEDPAINFHDSVSISKNPIYRRNDAEYVVGKEYWGVATWEDVDSESDFFNVQIQGLTNAYRAKQKADFEKEFSFKTLQINFFRRGDSIEEIKDSVDVGLPLVDDYEEQVRLCKFYNLPGPVFEVSEVHPQNDRAKHLFTADSTQDRDLNTIEVADLAAGKLPIQIVEKLAGFGIAGASATVTEKAKDFRWEFTSDVGGQQKLVRIDLKPQVWTKKGRNFEFIERVEHLWLYR